MAYGGVGGGERWEGSFLAQPGEAETCVERSFLKNFSPRKFLVETCAESNFVSSFSPRNGGRICHFAQVLAGNVCKLALQAPPSWPLWAILRRFGLVTSANWRSRHDICGEKLFKKLLSALVSGGNVRGEKL